MSTPQDEAARRQLRQQLDRNILCLAGAGAGKTHELIQRMVACIRQGRCEIGELAAITFTRKAAGELRGRFFEALELAAADHDAATPAEIQRLQQAVRHLDRCTMGTIHAFCARVLRQYPAQAGLPADFHEVEEREELWLARQAWDAFLEERSAAGDERLLAIEETGLTAEQFYHFFLRRCQFSDLPLKPTVEARPDLATPTQQLQAFVDEVAGQIPDPLPGEPDGLMKTINRLQHRFRFSAPSTDADRAFVLRSFDSSMATQVTLKRWGAKGSPEQHLARRLRDDLVKAVRTQMIQPALTAWRRYVYSLAADFVDEAMVAYRRRRLEQAMLTFNDLLEIAVKLLRDHSGVRRRLQQTYRILFVDEFQDTDPLQAQILLYLTGAEVDEASWQEQTPQPGRLFLVGDEKQSIYRFRRADVDVFRHMRQRLEAGGGEVVDLTTTFRARACLARWYNDTFEGLFEAQDLRYQADYLRLQSHREDAPGAGVYRLRSDARAQGREQQVVEEAQRVAAFIAAAVAGQTDLNGEGLVLGKRARPGDFLILTRTRRWLAHYGQALEEHGIAYDITGVGSLRSSGELRALVLAMEAVLQPDDAVAWVATLRGLLAGLGDDELYALRQAGYRFGLAAPIPDSIDADLAQRLSLIQTQLTQLRQDLVNGPTAAALERFVDVTGLLVAGAAQEGGSARAGNLMRVLSLVRDWQARRGLSWVRITAELRDLLDADEFRIEEMTLETGREDVVRVMNLHQAKGLQASVVFLVDPADTSAQRHAVDVHVSRLGDQPYLSMAVTGGGRKSWVMAEPEGWTQDAELENRYLAAEQLRLVYVAATRAADVLVVGQGTSHTGAWKDLHLGLRDVEDLPMPERVRAHPATDAEAAVDVVGLRERRRRRLDRSCQSSWEQKAVTDEEEEWRQAAEEQGHGRHFGLVVHRLLELCTLGRLDPEDDAGIETVGHMLLRDQGLEDAGLDQQVQETVSRWRSTLYPEIAASAEVHVEVPFAGRADTSVETGVIDLVYRRPDETWRLVDYKTQSLAGTDGVIGEDAKTAILRRYTRQLSRYAAHWQQVAGPGQIQAGLWLTAHGLWIPWEAGSPAP